MNNRKPKDCGSCKFQYVCKLEAENKIKKILKDGEQMRWIKRSKKQLARHRKDCEKAKARIKKRNETCVFGRKIKEMEERDKA